MHPTQSSDWYSQARGLLTWRCRPLLLPRIHWKLPRILETRVSIQQPTVQDRLFGLKGPLIDPQLGPAVETVGPNSLSWVQSSSPSIQSKLKAASYGLSERCAENLLQLQARWTSQPEIGHCRVWNTCVVGRDSMGPCIRVTTPNSTNT